MFSFPSLEPVSFSMSSSNCCFLTCIQVSQEVGKVVWYSCLLKNFPQFAVIHTIKGIVNEAEVNVFLFSGIPLLFLFLWSNRCLQFYLWFLCLSKSTLHMWNFLVHILLKPSLKNCEHYLANMWNEHNCVVAWTFFGIAVLADWSENISVHD